MRRKLQEIWPLARGAKQALLLLKQHFPESNWTRSDVRNEYRAWQRRELGNRTKVDVLLGELTAEDYFYR